MNHRKRVLEGNLGVRTQTVNEIASPKFAEDLPQADRQPLLATQL